MRPGRIRPVQHKRDLRSALRLSTPRRFVGGNWLAIAPAAVRKTAVMLLESPGYIALSAQTPESEVERWNAALRKLQRDGVVERLQGLYGR